MNMLLLALYKCYLFHQNTYHYTYLGLVSNDPPIEKFSLSHIEKPTDCIRFKITCQYRKSGNKKIKKAIGMQCFMYPIFANKTDTYESVEMIHNLEMEYLNESLRTSLDKILIYENIFQNFLLNRILDVLENRHLINKDTSEKAKIMIKRSFLI